MSDQKKDYKEHKKLNQFLKPWTFLANTFYYILFDLFKLLETKFELKVIHHQIGIQVKILQKNHKCKNVVKEFFHLYFLVYHNKAK